MIFCHKFMPKLDIKTVILQAELAVASMYKAL